MKLHEKNILVWHLPEKEQHLPVQHYHSMPLVRTKPVRNKESKSSRKKRKKKSSDDSESETESRKHKRKHPKHSKSPRKGSKHKKHHHSESEPSDDDDDDLQDLGNFDIGSPALEESGDNVADNQVFHEDNSNHEELSNFQRTELEIKKLLGTLMRLLNMLIRIMRTRKERRVVNPLMNFCLELIKLIKPTS